jgi:hypothetical protein
VQFPVDREKIRIPENSVPSPDSRKSPALGEGTCHQKIGVSENMRPLTRGEIISVGLIHQNPYLTLCREKTDFVEILQREHLPRWIMRAVNIEYLDVPG